MRPLAGLLRKGNAGSNTAADHITVLDQALASLPAPGAPTPDRWRTGGGGALRFGRATHRFARPAVIRGRVLLRVPPRRCPGLGCRGRPHLADGAGTRPSTQWGSCAMGRGWPRPRPWSTSRPGLPGPAWSCKERPIRGRSCGSPNIDGMRITAFITDTAPGIGAGQLAGLELRHRQHARVEDRIRQAKAAGLASLPCRSFDANAAWLEIVLAAADLVAWTQLIDSPHAPSWPAAKSHAFRYRVLHVAAASPVPASYGCASTPPGAGPPPSRPPGTASAAFLNSPPPVTRLDPKDPPAPGTPAHPGDTGRIKPPQTQTTAMPSTTFRGSPSPNPPARKIRVNSL